MLVQKSGAWFSFGEIRLGQGRENAKAFVKQNPELFEELKGHVLAAKGVKSAPDTPTAEPAEATVS